MNERPQIAWGSSPPVTTACGHPLLLVTFILLHRMLRKDKEEAEAIKHAKALEEEKAMYSVRAGPGQGALGVCLRRVHSSPTWYLPYSRAVAPGASEGSSGRSG